MATAIAIRVARAATRARWGESVVVGVGGADTLEEVPSARLG